MPSRSGSCLQGNPVPQRRGPSYLTGAGVAPGSGLPPNLPCRGTDPEDPCQRAMNQNKKRSAGVSRDGSDDLSIMIRVLYPLELLPGPLLIA